LTEHVLAAVKPKSLKAFSTLDPLITTSNNLDDEDPFQPPGGSLSSRVARLLQGEPPPEKAKDDAAHMALLPSRSDHSNNCPANNAATTLEEGAVPVRDFSHNLASEPASLVPSSASSVEDGNKNEYKDSMRRASSSFSLIPGGVHQEELRCVIAVVRHGDRTPKQKLKVNMTQPLILKYFHDHSDSPTKDLKVKAKAPMTEFLRTVKTLLLEFETVKEADDAGANKKKNKNKKLLYQLHHMRDILERWKFTGLNRKLQIKPRTWEEDEEMGTKRCTEVQLIIKWGGDLTKLGENQAIRLGERLRQELYPDAPGGGILRLHSTFRHDLKIKTSDEGRVMKTAAAFAKGLLELEGEIPPILVSLVHKEKGSMHMLDPSGDKEVKLELDECKEHITANLQRDIDYRETTEADRKRMVGPEQLQSMRDALAEVGNPRKTLMEIYKTMGYLIEELEEMLGMMGSGDEKRIEGGEGLKGEDEDDVALSGVKLYKGETLLELTERWKFIHKRLYDPDEDLFDLSRIPDVHDNVRFDVLHNPHLGLSNTLEKMYELAKSMADCVVPQEYGTSTTEKRSVGVKICSSLLEKIRFDLNIARTDNEVDMRYMINMDYSADLPITTMGRRIRTRLYFTSESHLHTMLNVMRFADSDGCRPLMSSDGLEFINNTRELCYLTQIVIRLFEDTGRPMVDPRRFRVEILFSPGATATPLHIHEANRGSDTARLDTAPLHMIGRDGLTCKEVEDFFGSAILEGAKPEDDDIDVASTTTAEFLRGDDSFAPKLRQVKVPKKSAPAPEEVQGNDEPVAAKEAPAPETKSEAPANPVENGKDVPVAMASSIRFTEPEKKEEEEEVKSRDFDKKEPADMPHKYFWSSVAMGTLLLGAGCLVMALSLTDVRSNRRRYTTRR
jgi:inositol hexakisphosphate/diphosphoinositol-pentakisphosphate kinase